MDALPCFFTFLIGIRVIPVIILHVFTFLVLYCDARYNFRFKTMFGSSLLPSVLQIVYVIFIKLYLFTYNGVQHDFRIKYCSCMFSSNTTSVTGGPGTSSPSRSHAFTRGFYLQVFYFCCRYVISKNQNVEKKLLSIPEPLQFVQDLLFFNLQFSVQ